MNKLVAGRGAARIAEKFAGDSQLVDMWISFLTHNGWIEKLSNDQNSKSWGMTDKGNDWRKSIEAKFAAENPV